MKKLLPLLGLLLLPTLAAAQTQTVEFRTQQATAWGESVYVAGDLAALGAGDLTRAPRMVPGSGGEWTLKVALPAGATYRYAFWIRNNDADAIANPQNGRQASADLSGVVPGTQAQRAVGVAYHSGWNRVLVRYRRGPGDVVDVELTRVAQGRHPAEWRYEGTLPTSEREVEFLPHNGDGDVDRPPTGGTYKTPLASFTLTDGRVHGAGQTAGGGRVLRVNGWYSNTLNNSRPVLIYLPPGYGTSSKRYPVLYMHDGQNLFGADAMFGGWRVADTCDRLIAAGQLEELIVVGVGNTSGRMSEYIPEADGGKASRYATFLTDEIKPWIDRSYRTRPGREDTGVCGSSLGGLVSVYLGWERPDVFGRVASLSGSFWLRGYVEQLERSSARPSLKIWLDSGNQGNSADSLENTLYLRDVLLRKGFALSGDLQHYVDYGGSHNERFWRGRLDKVLSFLFPPR